MKLFSKPIDTTAPLAVVAPSAGNRIEVSPVSFQPQAVVPKAARFFKIPHVVVRSQLNGEIDYWDLHNRLDPSSPAIINLNIGTTFKGAIDNIDRILEVLEARGIKKFYIHCDGALGAMLLPYQKPGWVSFNRPIHSLSISGHKFIGCPFPCGIVLTHNALAACRRKV